jgi:hypothetical protein
MDRLRLRRAKYIAAHQSMVDVVQRGLTDMADGKTGQRIKGTCFSLLEVQTFPLVSLSCSRIPARGTDHQMALG